MATPRRGGGHEDNGYGELSEQLREPIDLLRQELAVLGQRIESMNTKREDGPTRHLRRFGPFYALATIWVVMLSFFPTAREAGPSEELSGIGLRTSQGSQARGSEGTSALGYDPSQATSTAGTDPGTVVSSAGGAAVQGARQAGGAAKSAQQQAASLLVGSGVTRGGFECKPGVRQLPWSAYAAQCVGKYSLDNGGATTRGVTKDKIILADRQNKDSANRAAAEAFAASAGAASSDVAREVRNTFRKYFNDVFELYGRKVEWVEFTESPTTNTTEEAQSRGKEGACIDATKVAEEIKAFAVQGSSGPYSECLAERKVVSFGGGAYFPETWYRKHHPYLYNGIMECERISYQVAEYMGKRLAKRPAKWAGDVLMQKQARKFGTYVPNNDEYQHCVKISERVLKEQYGADITSRYNYTLDLSRFPDEALRGITQFKAAGVTTIVNACDPYSTLFMTQAATGQQYYPEWYMIGVALQDVESVARTWDQKQVDGHTFGMSQLSRQEVLIGPNSEPGVTYKKVTGKDIPLGTDGQYYTLIRMFSMLQAAGPNLTAENMERAIHQMMPGGPPAYAFGYASYADGPDGTAGGQDHTWIDDSREIYYCGTCKSSYDGKDGRYIETMNGKRFRNNEWPAEEPPVYPPGYAQTFAK